LNIKTFFNRKNGKTAKKKKKRFQSKFAILSVNKINHLSLAEREGEERYIEGNREKEKRDRRERREWDREREEREVNLDIQEPEREEKGKEERGKMI
jgi:hypothetical protein